MNIHQTLSTFSASFLKKFLAEKEMPAVASRANIHKHSRYTLSLSGTDTMCGFVAKTKTEPFYPALFSKEHM